MRTKLGKWIVHSKLVLAILVVSVLFVLLQSFLHCNDVAFYLLVFVTGFLLGVLVP